MPLAPGGSREVFSRNVVDVIRAGHPRAQALAASYREQRQHRAPGGPVMPMAGGMGAPAAPQAGLGNLAPTPIGASAPPVGMPPRPPGLTPQGGLGALGAPLGRRPPGMAAGGPASPPWFVKNEAHSLGHVGPIHSMVAGRTDHISASVPQNSHVIPADIVSGLGQGNTANGHALLGRMMASGPFGAGVMKGGHGMGPPKPPRMVGGFAKGGAPGDVPVMLSGGEFVVPPHVVAAIGGGDIDHGHAILDEFIKQQRKKLISTLKKLPGPAK